MGCEMKMDFDEGAVEFNSGITQIVSDLLEEVIVSAAEVDLINIVDPLHLTASSR
jgi:hypothetical protein